MIVVVEMSGRDVHRVTADQPGVSFVLVEELEGGLADISEYEAEHDRETVRYYIRQLPQGKGPGEAEDGVNGVSGEH